MAIHKIVPFACSPQQLWEIVGTPDRVDWVPGVTNCEFDGEVRSLSLPGAGSIKERILAHDDQAMTMQYSCIESPAPLEKHLASIQITASPGGCEMQWQTEVEPAAFEPFIEDSMNGALKQIQTIIDQS
jgi:hypothetical protein